MSALDDVPERLLRFRRVRAAASIVLVEDDRGVFLEARLGRRLLQRTTVGARDGAVFGTELYRALEGAQTLLGRELTASFGCSTAP
jgi:hypothetical protein